MACLISKDNEYNCDAQETAGVQPYVILYNWVDWRAIVDAGNVTKGPDGEITSIVNTTGVRGYKYTFANSGALIPSTPLVPIAGAPSTYNHGLNMNVATTDQASKNEIDKMRGNPVVAIPLRVNGTAEVYGNDQGMTLSANNWNPQAPDLGNTIPIELLTDPNQGGESKMPVEVDAGSGTLTKALLEGLLTPGV